MFNFIYFSFFISFPYYFVSSGLPQVSHIFMLVGILYFVSIYYKNLMFEICREPYAVYFLLYVILINTIYMIYFIDMVFFKYTLYYIFNISIFYMTIVLLKMKKISLNVVVYSLLVGLLLLLFFGYLFIDINFRERESLFFNNPNQLGYYGLLIATLYSIIDFKGIKNKYYTFLYSLSIYILSFILIFLSSSLTAIIGFFLLIIFNIIQYVMKNFQLKSFISMILIVLLGATVFINSNIENNMLLKRVSKINKKVENLVQDRGYDRIVNNDEYILFGAGEGRFERFDSEHKGELHSTLGNILFSYGFIGFILFLLILYSNYMNWFKVTVFISPLLVYSLTHNGIRNPLFWIFLAIIVVNFKRNKSQAILESN